MKGSLIALALAGGLAVAAPAQLGAPPADPLECLAAVQQATDPTTAADAYERGLELGGDPLTFHQAFVYRMVELGLPGQAESAAEALIEADAQNGVAWAVLAFCDAARNDTTAALAEMATAVDYAPGDPFVLGVAGKLMAWYRYPGLGDPRELPADLAARLDEIHAQYSADEYYRAAFDAAYEYYDSQAREPIAEYPDEVPIPYYGDDYYDYRYDPAVCVTYPEYVYSGFVVPSFSFWYVVPRVRTYVFCERHVHRHLRFHIYDRHVRYCSPFHVRRLAFARSTRYAAFHLSVRARVAPPRGVTLPPPRPRYGHTLRSPRLASRGFGPTRPPPPVPRWNSSRRGPLSGPGRSDHLRATPPRAPGRSAVRPGTPRSPGVVPPPSRNFGTPTRRFGAPSSPSFQNPQRSRSAVRPPSRLDTRPPSRRPDATAAPGVLPPPRSRADARPQARPDMRSPSRPDVRSRPGLLPSRPPSRLDGRSPARPDIRSPARPDIQSPPRSGLRPPAGRDSGRQPGPAIRPPSRSIARPPARPPTPRAISPTPRSTPASPRIQPPARPRSALVPRSPSATPQVGPPRSSPAPRAATPPRSRTEAVPRARSAARPSTRSPAPAPARRAAPPQRSPQRARPAARPPARSSARSSARPQPSRSTPRMQPSQHSRCVGRVQRPPSRPQVRPQTPTVRRRIAPPQRSRSDIGRSSRIPARAQGRR